MDKKEVNSVIILIIIILSVSLLFSLIESIEERKLKKDLKPEYDKAILKIGNLNEELQRCEKTYADKSDEYQILKCNYEKNKIKEKYDTCVLFSTRNICLYENNYEKINCSVNSLRKRTTGLPGGSGFLFNVVTLPEINCKDISDEVDIIRDTIKRYEDISN